MDYSDLCHGTWGNTQPGQPHLSFAEDGTVAGTDGCNRLMGRWSREQDVITLSQMASTMMYCEGVDMWLTAAATASVHETDLHVFDREGTQIGTLKRSV